MLITAAATVLVAAACSSSGTVGAGGAGKLDLDTVSAADAIRAASAAQAAKHSVHVHSTYTSKKITEDIDGVQSTERAAADSLGRTRVAGSSSEVHGEIRLDAPIVYLDNPGLPDEYRHGKRWVKLDLDHLPPANSPDRALALYANLGSVYRGMDPKQGSLFPLLMPDLHRVGVETRDGRRTLHLQGSYTGQTLPAAPPPGSGVTQAYLDDRRAQMSQTGVTKTTFDVWVGDDALVVASRQTDDLAAGPATSDLTMSDWGAPLTITAPPADQTYTVPAQ